MAVYKVKKSYLIWFKVYQVIYWNAKEEQDELMLVLQ